MNGAHLHLLLNHLPVEGMRRGTIVKSPLLLWAEPLSSACVTSSSSLSLPWVFLLIILGNYPQYWSA
jgi:hypothetical protein